MRTISKRYSFRKKFRKTLQGRRMLILKFSQDIPQNNFLNFLASKNIFITSIIFRGYSWNIFETDIRGKFIEYSGNIISWLLEFVERSIFAIIKSYTFNTKLAFPLRTFKKSFTLEFSLNDSSTLQSWENTQLIFPEYYMPARLFG